MKITASRRLASLAGLLFLSLLLVAVFVQAAPAINDYGSGVGGGITVASAGTTQPGSLGRAVTLPAGVAAARAPAPTSSSMSSTTVWTVTGIVIAALVVAIAAWAIVRSRRRSARPSAEYCTLHPSDALCGVA